MGAQLSNTFPLRITCKKKGGVQIAYKIAYVLNARPHTSYSHFFGQVKNATFHGRHPGVKVGPEEEAQVGPLQVVVHTGVIKRLYDLVHGKYGLTQ